jgi:GNAT superfamily N-acetyltransferase
MPIAIADTDAEIDRCFPVMVQLRPNLTAAEFVPRVRRQQQEGYRLVFLEDNGVVRCVAGFRIHGRLHSGRTMYVDDLVTDSAARSQGHGDRLFDWLVQHAREAECLMFSLDSGTHRVDAHRFYLRKRMRISCFHFDLPL